MRQAILLSFFIGITSMAFAGNRSAATRDSVVKIPGAAEMLMQIINATGLQTSVTLKEDDVPNLQAVIQHGQRYIIYNPTYVSAITKVTNSKWAAMALLAHELGHHLNGHTLKRKGSKPSLELEADEFAGFILHKLGATLAESQQVMYHIARTESSSTHPGRQLRINAIAKGWYKATGTAVEVASSLP